jgi:hypothetical protein
LLSLHKQQADLLTLRVLTPVLFFLPSVHDCVLFITIIFIIIIIIIMAGSRKVIPIPSFSTTSCDDEDMPPQQQQETKPAPKSPAAAAAVSVEKQWVLQLESALQFYFSQKKIQRISYKDFCTLVPKLALGPSVGNAAAASASSTNDTSQTLSKEERLWHDFYCVSVPTLYNVVRQDASVFLEALPLTGNRWKLLRSELQQVQQDGVSPDKSAKALELLACCVELPTPLSESTITPPPPQVKPDEILAHPTAANQIQPGMTLEERVRTRAKKRQETLQQIDDAKKDPHEDCLYVADALFTHARHILRRRSKSLQTKTQSQSQSQSQSQQATKCVLTFHDVVQTIPNFNRHQVTETLQEIRKRTPHWISWIDPQHGINGTPITKSATVSIPTANYKQIRAILSGQPIPVTTEPALPTPTPIPVTTEPTLQTPPPPLAPIINEASTTTTTARPVTVSGSKRTLSALTAAAARTAEIVSSNKKPRVPAAAAPTTQADASTRTKAKASSTKPSSNGNGNVKKRPLQDDDDSEDDPVLKKRRGLRINHNLILCDDDYDGGRIVQPSLELPRGLRRLFLRMNAGERI